MKNIISLVIVCMVLSFNPILIAQIEVKTVKTSKDSDKNTETKTGDLKSDQKDNIGGYTKSGKQVTFPTSTEPVKDPSAKKEPGSDKKLPPSSGGIVYDRMGEVMVKVEPDGKIYDLNGLLKAQYTTKGEYLGPNGELLGTISNGVIKTKKGKVLGKLSKDGKVTNAKGKLLGTIYDDGVIRNSKGSRLGSAPGINKNIAAMIFFVKKKRSRDRKQKKHTEPTFKSKPDQQKSTLF